MKTSTSPKKTDVWCPLSVPPNIVPEYDQLSFLFLDDGIGDTKKFKISNLPEENVHIVLMYSFLFVIAGVYTTEHRGSLSGVYSSTAGRV